ncbi:MAG: CoA-binding protein [Paracoccaceae bacterium]|nr:MAG: CoA-binding protein [Paracoccaceae bacterium]
MTDTPPEPVPDAPDDATLRAVLTGTRVVAVVGLSANPLRASHFVARYLGLRGMRIIPVNPGLAGQTVLGEVAVAQLSDIPPEAAVDMVDVFRRAEEVPAVLEAALAHLPHLRTFWMQIGIRHPEAAALARGRGLTVVQNRCPKQEWQRLFGELRMGGINTGIVSSRL